MFGESESESPRVPSPWDLLLSPDALDKVYHRQDELLFSQLAAEVEEVGDRPDRFHNQCAHFCDFVLQGNVEYKLHLINPSPARFARLVTQMKWRLLEGGGQAIYELGVADSGALVGLRPGDLRATFDTLHAMAAEIGARVVISKEIEVTAVATAPELGFRALAEKRHGSRDGRRTAIKNHQQSPRAQALSAVVDTDSPRSFVSAASIATSSSDDSTRSLSTDSGSLPPASSPLSSPSPPSGAISIPVCKDEMGHGDDSLVFPMLTEEGGTPADSLLDDGESFIGYTLLGAIPEKPLTRVEGEQDIRELYRVQHKVDVGPGSVALAVPAADASLDRDEELLLVALGKLDIADSPSAPEEHKRTIVEAMVIRELDHEEGFIDFSSF